MTASRPGLNALGSLIVEDLRATPAAAHAAALGAAADDPANRLAHLTDACYAALLACEPKRALRQLAEISGSANPRLVHAIQAWAAQLDQNWYPDNVGSEVAFDDPSQVFVTAQPAGDEAEVIEHLLEDGSHGISQEKVIIEVFVRRGAVRLVNEVATSSLAQLRRLAAFGQARGRPDLAAWAGLASADIMFRSGAHDQARAQLASQHAFLASAQLTAADALAWLLEGDWNATPGACPQTLGFDVRVYRRPNPWQSLRDLGVAQACYERAAHLAAALPFPMMHAAIDVRFGALSWLSGDHTGHRQHLNSALAHSQQAGDSAGWALAMAHLFLADLADGAIATHALELGSGWTRPKSGPIAALIDWALHDGSRSWVVGLGRLIQACANQWKSQGEHRRAQLAFFAALQLVALEPSLSTRPIATAAASAEAALNLTTAALIRLQRSASERGGSAVDEKVALLHRLDELAAMAAAWGVRARYGDVRAADALERLRPRFEALLADPAYASVNARRFNDVTDMMAALDAIAEADPNMSVRDQLALFKADAESVRTRAIWAGVAKDNIALIDTIVPLARAEAAQRVGNAAEADRLYAQAEAAGREPGPPWRLPVVLLMANRIADARAVLTELTQSGVLDAKTAAPLWLQAGDANAASTAFMASGGPDRAAIGWNDTLTVTAAEIALALGDNAAALRTARNAIDKFEQFMSAVVRDADRLALADQTFVASLYSVAARSADASGSVELAVAYSERARTLTIDEEGCPGGASMQWDAWQRAAAERQAVADRLVAAMEAGEPDLSSLIAGVDAADEALAQAEADVERVDPGVLLRRTARPHLRGAGEIQPFLPPGVVALEYLLAGHDLTSFAVTADGVDCWQHKVASRHLAALIQAHHQQCADGCAQGAEATELAELLLSPAAEFLRAGDRVLVSPFGALNLIPFHALPFDGAPLGVTHVVSYLPHVGMLASPGRPLDDRANIDRALIVGNPEFDQMARPELRRLDGASLEARVAGLLLGIDQDDVLIGRAAREDTVRGKLADRDLLMFATHGLLDASSPFASSLVLAGTDELTVAELVGMHVGSRLAVLSACDTGRGDATLGGDVIGLTRSLLRAGVRQAVVSLWPVDDEIAPVTMCRFLAEVKGGAPVASALAAAQRFVYRLGAEELAAEYERLGGDRPDLAAPGRRSRRRAPVLPPGLRDEEEIPTPLSGDAERYWAPFVLVGV